MSFENSQSFALTKECNFENVKIGSKLAKKRTQDPICWGVHSAGPNFPSYYGNSFPYFLKGN